MLLLNSKYTLCPSGSGPNSIRLWESLACGSIPIILSDTLDLPSHKINLVETSFFNILKRSKPSPRENSILLGLAQKIKLHLEKKF